MCVCPLLLSTTTGRVQGCIADVNAAEALQENVLSHATTEDQVRSKCLPPTSLP